MHQIRRYISPPEDIEGAGGSNLALRGRGSNRHLVRGTQVLQGRNARDGGLNSLIKINSLTHVEVSTIDNQPWSAPHSSREDTC